jgi:hypothetical protein
VKRLPVAGCSCAAVLGLFVLCTPLLLFGVGGTASAGADDVTAPGGSSCAPAVGCQAIPPGLIGVPSGFFPDAFTTPPGQCTSWAAALWPGRHGRGVSWSGDAWQWYANARSAGYAVSDAPSVGAIAVFQRSTTVGGDWGHVAVVVGVSASSFVVSEMNRDGRFVVDTRTVPVDAAGLEGFIPVPADAWS